MAEYLITATLLNSWQYLLKNEYSNMENFLKVLNREKFETTEAQQKGYDFEKWAMENYEETLNGQYQVKLHKHIRSFMGTDFVLYGILDCVKGGKIYDYKHTNQYEVGKFFNNCQTSMYLELCEEAKEMKYIIGTDKPQYQISDEDDIKYNLFYETYSREDVKPIKDIIYNFENWLLNTNLYELYKEKWISKGDKE